MRFKPGDRVFLARKTHAYAINLGAKATVGENKTISFVHIIWDKPCRQMDGSYYPRDFDKFAPDTFEEDGEE